MNELVHRAHKPAYHLRLPSATRIPDRIVHLAVGVDQEVRATRLRLRESLWKGLLEPNEQSTDAHRGRDVGARTAWHVPPVLDAHALAGALFWRCSMGGIKDTLCAGREFSIYKLSLRL